jgi:hypothetical protein
MKKESKDIATSVDGGEDRKNVIMVDLLPKEQKILTLIDEYKDLKIDGLDDKAGYKKVDRARITLGKEITDVKKISKGIRKELTVLRKATIKREEDLIGIAEPRKDELAKMLKDHDEAVLMKKMEEVLPERKAMLKAIDVKISDKELLLMSDPDFKEFYSDKKLEHAEKLQEEIDEKLRKIEEAEEKAKAKEETEKEAIKEVKEELRDEVKEEVKEEIKQESEKELSVVDNDPASETANDGSKCVCGDDGPCKEHGSCEKEEQPDKPQVTRDPFSQFLLDNGCNKDTKSEFYLREIDGQKILYKKVAVYNI